MSWRWVHLLLGALAAGLAAHALDRWPLWVAELWTFEASDLDLWRAYRRVVNDRSPPLHVFLVKGSRALWDSEPGGRLPSLVGALVAAAAVWSAARRRLGDGAAAVALLGLVLSPPWLAHCGVARPYALLMGSGGVLLWGALSIDARPRRAAAALALGGIAGLYLHHAAVGPVLVAILVAMGVAWGRPSARRWVLVAAVCTFLAWLPWLLGPMQHQTGRSTFGPPDLRSLRALLFLVDEHRPWEGLVLALLGLAGLCAAAIRRQWALLAMGLGAMAAPLLLSVAQESQTRSYVHLGLLPAWALMLGALAQGPGHRGIMALLAVGVLAARPAWETITLPSAPFGRHGDPIDDGLFDVREDMARIQAALPEGARLWVPDTREPNLLLHYAQRAEALRPGAEPGPDDWVLRPVDQGRDPGAEGPCVLSRAFSLALHLPDGEGCAAVAQRLLADRPGAAAFQRAALQAQTPAREDELRLAARTWASPAPELHLADLLSTQGEHGSARAMAEHGTKKALRGGWIQAAGRLQEQASKAARADGDPRGADEAQATAACLKTAPPALLLPERCRWSWARWSVGAASTPPRRPGSPQNQR